MSGGARAGATFEALPVSELVLEAEATIMRQSRSRGHPQPAPLPAVNAIRTRRNSSGAIAVGGRGSSAPSAIVFSRNRCTDSS